MRYFMKLGPVEFEDAPPAWFYFSLGDHGVDDETGDDDAQALARLASRGRREPTVCEPALAAAAATLGLKVAELPPDPVAFKAAMAVALDWGEGLAPDTDPVLLFELIDALAAFDRAKVWDAFAPDE